MPLPIAVPTTAAACPACRHSNFQFSGVQAVGLYEGPLRDAVLRMKKSHEEALTLTMGRVLADILRFPENSSGKCDDSGTRDRESLASVATPWAVGERSVGRASRGLDPPDLVVPVPMHWTRRVTRGTNPAELVAEMVSHKLRIPAVAGVLYNRRKTRKQGTLLPDQRRRNVRQAFAVSAGYDIKQTHVLLIDDVMTTGATVNELSKLLQRAGANRISVAVVARGTG